MSKAKKKKKRITKEKQRLANKGDKPKEKLFPKYITGTREMYEFKRRYVYPLKRKIYIITLLIVILWYIWFMLTKTGRLW